MSDQHPKDSHTAAPEEALQDYVDMMLEPCDLDVQVEQQTAEKLRQEQTKLAAEKKSKVAAKAKSQLVSKRKRARAPAQDLLDSKSAAALFVSKNIDATPLRSSPTTLPLNRTTSIDIPVLDADYRTSSDALQEPQPQRQQTPTLADGVLTQTLEDVSASPESRQALKKSLVRDRVKQLTDRLPNVKPELSESVPTVGSPAAESPVAESPVAESPVAGSPTAEAESLAPTPIPERRDASLQAPSSGSGYSRVSDRVADPVELAQPVVEHTIPDGWSDNGRPVWAQQPFECLLFKLSGLTLAVPLVELGSIYPMHNELTPIFGQADWFLGLFSVQNISLRAVDTAKVIMPERYKPSMKESLRYVISINGFDWGLAVDEVDEAITLTPDDVRWRTSRSKRPWLAGTVVQQMCALIDVRAMAREFEKASKPGMR